jgi:hypothetical protein
MCFSHKIQYSWWNWRDVVFLSFVHSLWTKILIISYNSTFSQFPSTSIYYRMRPGSLGKRLSRPKLLMSVGRHLWSHSRWNSYQNLGLLHGVRHVPPTAGVQTWREQSPQVLHYEHIEETKSDSHFLCKSNSFIATSKHYHACITAQAQIRPQSKCCP